MDKFGIFNLLNSFFTPAKPQTQQSDTNFTAPTNNANDFLSGLLNSLSSSNNDKNQQLPPQNKAPSHPPLQSGMINVMNNHDAFIKRVNARSNARKNDDFAKS